MLVSESIMTGAAAMSEKSPFEQGRKLATSMLAPLLAAWISVMAPAPVLAQTPKCALSPDERNPSEKVLRCGDLLTIQNATNTSYSLTDQKGDELPKGAQLDSGALMIEFKPSRAQRSFQIQTPHAIAAVRGTNYAVEVDAEKTGTLVISGVVEVRRPNAKKGVRLRAGQGTDVSGGTGALTVKRWGKPRVDALLARFGR
jgi:FecR protein